MEEYLLPFFEIVGSLFGVIAVIYARSISHQLQIEREDNKQLWEQLGELRAAVQQTRESYLTKNDFNGTVNRLFSKLDSIEMKLSSIVTKQECRELRMDRKALES